LCLPVPPPHTLPPAAPLPGRRLHEMVEEVGEALIERVRVERTVRRLLQQVIHGLAIDLELPDSRHPAVQAHAEPPPFVGVCSKRWARQQPVEADAWRC